MKVVSLGRWRSSKASSSSHGKGGSGEGGSGSKEEVAAAGNE